MAINLKIFCLRYILLTIAIWIAIPVALGLLPAIGFGGATVNGIILVAAAPAFASIFMAGIYVKSERAVPPWKLIGILLAILVPVFMALSLLMNGIGQYLTFFVMNATMPNVPAMPATSIFNVQSIHIVNTAFSSLLGIGVIFPLRAKGELRKMEYREAREDTKP